MTILEQIVAARRERIANAPVEASAYESSPLFSLPRRSMRRSLEMSSTGVIAEFKRRSPSRGALGECARCGDTVRRYEALGAAGVSILTEPDFFSGSTVDLEEGRRSLSRVPILMKDFVISEKQILQARASGADCILLIARLLSPEEVRQFSSFARALELEALLEVHDREELQRSYCSDISLVGVNNRNLEDFSVSLNRSLELIEHIPRNTLPISESGITSRTAIHTLRSAGFQGFLVGEAAMKDPISILDPSVQGIESRRPFIKVCGVRECISTLASLSIDYLGLIFVPESPRYIPPEFKIDLIDHFPQKLVGVFRDATVEAIIKTVDSYGLKAVQLHGEESPQFCAYLKGRLPGIEIFRALSLPRQRELVSHFTAAEIDYLILDGVAPGSGIPFDWSLLSILETEVPFFLAGGICLESVPVLRSLLQKQEKLIGFDLNSRFESAPGRKDLLLINRFLEEIFA